MSADRIASKRSAMPAWVSCAVETSSDEFVSEHSVSPPSRRRSSAGAASGCGGSERIAAATSSGSGPSPSIFSAARCAVEKSTYRSVITPTNASWSICPNHRFRAAASPNSPSSARRSSNVSLTSKAMTRRIGAS